MACCDNLQKCTLGVVNVGYIKEFIKQGTPNYMIQKSSDGSEVTVDSGYSDEYCPTYGELIAGDVIQTSSYASHPSNDRDGIYIRPVHKGTNLPYTSEQEVDKSDFMVRYTRLNSMVIGSDEDLLSECSGSTHLNYTNYYVRNTYRLNDNCTSGLTQPDVVRTTSGDTFSFTFPAPSHYGRITDAVSPDTGKIYSIDKNGAVSSNTRSDLIVGVSTFRGSNVGSNNLIITQEGLTGTYEAVAINWYANALTKSVTSQTVDNCASVTYGVSFYVDAYPVQYYVWRDSCGIQGGAQYNETGSTRQIKVAEYSGVWPKITCPTETAHTESAVTYTFTGGRYDGKDIYPEQGLTLTDSVTFTRDCNQDCCDPTVNDYSFSGSAPTNKTNLNECGGQIPLGGYVALMRCNSSESWQQCGISFEVISYTGDNYVHFSLSNDGKSIIVDYDMNCVESTRTSTYTLSLSPVPINQVTPSSQSVTVSFTQNAGKCGNCPCDCSDMTISLV